MTSPDKPDSAAGAAAEQPVEPVADTAESATSPTPAEGTGQDKPAKREKVDGSGVTSAAPPPWQRVPGDARYAQQNADAGSGSSTTTTTVDRDKPTERFSDWGYTKAKSDDYGVNAEGRPAGYPVVTGTSAASATPGATPHTGTAGNEAGGRTTVNLGGPGTRGAGGAAPTALRRPGRGPRRASLQVKRVDPWSVLKLAFVLSVALFFVWLVAVGVLYGVLAGMGVWDQLNGAFNDLATGANSAGSGPLITVGRVFGIAAIIGAINIVLFTAIATVGAFVYNVSADLAGGLEITLAERE